MGDENRVGARASRPRVSPPPPLNTKRGATDWKLFKQIWSNYVIVAELQNEPPAYLKALFLHTLGADGLTIYNGLELAEGATVNDILTALDTHFIGKTNETYERFVFNKRDQKEGECIEDYINSLRQLIKTCNFTHDMTDSLLRDRLVLGIRSHTTRQELIQDSNLTLQTCIEKCRSAEATSEQMKVMGEEGQAHAVRQRSRKEKTEKKGENEDRKCKFCGGRHRMKKVECPAWGEKCDECGKLNHFKKVCLAKKEKKDFKKKPRVHAVQETDEDDSDDEYVLAVGKESDKIIKAKMLIGGKKIICQVDSGASVNVISVKHVDERLLSETKTTLNVYNGAKIRTLGKAELEILNPKTEEARREEFIVVKEDLMTLLGKTTSEKMNLITIHYDNLSIAKVEETTTDPLKAYADVFAEEQGSLEGIAHLETDPAVIPVISPSAKIPHAMRSKVKDELDRLEDANVIAKIDEPTSWCSRMLVATKKSGKLRICIDPRPLNKALKRERYPIPTMDDILPQLTKSKFFSKLDLSNAYWHVHLDEESSKLTTFQTPHGRYRWKRLPFGTSVSSEIFQKRLDQALEGLQGVIGVSDDIVVHGETEEEHDKNLRNLLELCRKIGLRLNRGKAEIKKQEISFLGHLITSDGLKIDPEKLEAIKKMPKPEDVEGVRRFCGFVNYLAKFLPKLSDVLEPIRQLTRDDVPWTWTATQDQAFAKVQQLVTEAPVLAFYDPSKDLMIQCDASQSGLGAVLLQNGKPLAYCSRALTPTERNYAQIEKELLAIVFSVEKWHQYAFGRHISVQSDHKPLETIFNKPLSSAPRRLQGMMLRLQGYELTVKYTRGKDLVLADTLSRAFLQTVPSKQEEFEMINMVGLLPIRPERLSRLKEETRRDANLQMLIETIIQGWPEDKCNLSPAITPYFNYREEMTVQDGLIFRGDRVLVPQSLRSEMMKAVHSTHSGIEGCLKRARECIFWPGMSADIKNLISSCEVCQSYSSANQQETLIPHEVPSRPWEKVGLDLFEIEGKDYLITVDYLSNFWEIDRLRDTKASTVIKALKAHFARYGSPCTVVSDNGPQFVSDNFKRFAKDFDFEHVTSSPYHSRSNGKAESAVKTAKSILRKNREEDQFLALLNHRNTPSQNSNTSPAQKFFNRRTRTLLPTHNNLLSPQVTLEKDIPKIRESQQTSKGYYDKRSKDLKPLGKGDSVMIKPQMLGRKQWTRGTVLDNRGRTYDIQTAGNQVIRRNRVHLRQVPPEPAISVPLPTPVPEPVPTPQVQEPSAEAPAPASPCKTAPVKTSGPSPGRTRSGRLVKPNQLKDFVY